MHCARGRPDRVGVRAEADQPPPLGYPPVVVPQSPSRLPQQVAINARAAVRSEIGGVERLAREMALRLPALRPDRYRVIRPAVKLAHRAGHVWEQTLLPVQALGR